MPDILTAPPCRATIDSGKIHFTGRTYGGPAEFIGTLPAATWNRFRRCWTCRITPFAAWRIVEDGRFAVEPELEEMAVSVAAMLDRRDETLPMEQPPNRRGELWPHQVEAYHHVMAGTADFMNCAMGTGKSAIAVTAIINTDTRNVIVLCPVSVLGVWRREFRKWAGWHDEVLVLDGGQTAKRKARIAREHRDRCEGRGIASVIVVNYETAWSKAFADFSLSVSWDWAICDESHRIKGHNTQVSKYAAKVGARSKWRLCLTGTPFPHSPLDVFGQMRFLEPAVYGTHWHRFISRYAIKGGFENRQIVACQNLDELAERMRPFMFEVGQDVLTLPDVSHEDVPVVLSAKTRAAYKDFEKHLVAEIEALIEEIGDDDASGVLAANNPMVKLLRLQQLTSGYAVVERDDGSETTVETGREKRRALAELIDGIAIDDPVVVFCRFRHDLEAVEAVAEKAGRTYGELSGRRKDLTGDAEMPEGIGVFGVQIQSGGVGVDLTRACYGVYYSVGYSLGDFEQSVARMHRPGQTRPVRYYHLIAEKTVDRKIYDALRNKRRVVDAVLEHLRESEKSSSTGVVFS